jgi:hypothetical protein
VAAYIGPVIARVALPGRRGRWAVVVAALVAAGACGGSVTPGVGSSGGGGADGGGGGSDATSGVDVNIVGDTSPGVDSMAPEVGTPTQTYDGTTGKACMSNTDCLVPGGPGVAQCSSTVFVPQSYYPTPVCILPTCSPVSDATVHYCDGPDVPSSPGICVPQSTGGICLPKCTYDKTGDPAVGCQGKDACFVFTSATSGGAGYCWGGCTQNGDCPTGQQCQTDQGLCMEGVVPPTKTFGTACTKADSDDGACNCLYGGTTDTGYCSTFCVVGAASGCAAGQVCDGLEYRQDGYTMSNPGLGGFCAVACTAGDAGPACPPSSSCTDVLAAGPDCVP